MSSKSLPTVLLINTAITIGLAALVPSAAQKSVGPSQAPPLSVVAELQQTVVHQYQPIKILVRVINKSDTAQSFRVFTCSWEEEWQVTDTRFSFPDVSCAANALITVTLAPDADYKRDIVLTQGLPPNPPNRPGKLSFKVGFTPVANQKDMTDHSSDITYWSAPIVMQLVK